MKKIITAKEQWTKAMNVYLEKEDYDCLPCCDGLGAIGDNEFYKVFDMDSAMIFFEKYGDEYKMIDTSNVYSSDLLYNNWHKLDPADDWYNKEKVMDFLLHESQGFHCDCPIAKEDLVWMGIYSEDDVCITEFWDKEVEVSTEEIEAIRKEIVERCKGHSLEEIRDMFQGRTSDALGEPGFDFEYEGLEFYIYDDDNNEWWLGSEVYQSGVGVDYTEDQHVTCKALKLPIPPKEIKLDMSDIVDEKPDLSMYKSFASISFDGIVEHMRHSCLCLISDIYQKIGEKYVEIDTKEWLETHGYFADYQDYYTVALTRNSKGDVVLTGTDTAEWDEYMTANDWSFVSLEEMLYIINQLTSK